MTFRLAAAIAVTCAAATGPVLAQAKPAPLPVWLVGCWERAGNAVTEERWLPPKGGMMFGVSTTLRGERAVSWEQIRIDRVRDRLVYHPFPSGQLPSSFPATVESDTLLVFEDLYHDFPQRVIYRRRPGADSLHARVEGMVRDSLRAVDFKYRRVSCPTN